MWIRRVFLQVIVFDLFLTLLLYRILHHRHQWMAEVEWTNSLRFVFSKGGRRDESGRQTQDRLVRRGRYLVRHLQE